jgi:uncharacterized caspase-like protein
MARRALLVGINRYRMPGADLRGCVNDVKNLHSLLTGTFGFNKKDIAVLTDFDATTSEMQAGIKDLVSSGREGDVLLFHYSGHGSNVPDDNGDEADKRDEILCPTDLDWKKPLRDDWLRKAFDKLRAGVSLTVIMDCCHSGTNTRQVLPPDAPVKERYLPSPWDLVAAESGRKLRGKVRGTLRGSRPAKRAGSDVVDAKIAEVLITGCRDTQTSADAFIAGSYNGALTYYLVSALRAGGPATTYRDLRERAAAEIKRNGYEQVPQLEGRKAALARAFLAPV